MAAWAWEGTAGCPGPAVAAAPAGSGAVPHSRPGTAGSLPAGLSLLLPQSQAGKLGHGVLSAALGGSLTLQVLGQTWGRKVCPGE